MFLAYNRRIVMDEFVQFGWAKYIATQIDYLAKHHPKALGYAIFFEDAHLIGWDARSMLLIGRMQTAALACGTLAMVYACARAIGQSQLRAGMILLVLLSFSNFIERIFETRAEPLATFFATAALLVLVRGRNFLRWGHPFAGGVFAGLAFLSTQKAIYFDVALGLALLGDAAIERQYRDGIVRGAWLISGWLVPFFFYILLLGGDDPVSVARNLIIGPVGVVSPQIANEYGGLRQYVVQTLFRNALLYLLCFSGMALALLRIRLLRAGQRVALLFSLIITLLVFIHNQPWPYVFIMALPFLALWALGSLDALSEQKVGLAAAEAVIAVAVTASFVRNFQTFAIDNHKQLEVVERAEALLRPRDVYFDGIGMLPNRFEPSILWLDRHTILTTMSEGGRSELYSIFTKRQPKLIIWSYRMDAVDRLVGPLIHESYVQISPNLRIAGRMLHAGRTANFDVPVADRYDTYDVTGSHIGGSLIINGKFVRTPVKLGPGQKRVTLTGVSGSALLLPEWDYHNKLDAMPDSPDLFADVYN